MDTYGSVSPTTVVEHFPARTRPRLTAPPRTRPRYVAKHIVAAGLADKCEIQVAYAIGVARPVSLMVNTFGTGTVPETRLETLVQDIFDLRPKAIIQELDLLRPIFKQTAAYGHFGREEPDFTWEATDKVEQLGDAAG